MLKNLTSSLNYAMLAIPLAMLGLPVYIYLPNLYQQHFAMSLSAIGSALLLARMLDVITDPIIGQISDKLKPAISRKTQIYIASLLLCLSLAALLLPHLIFKQTTVSWLQLFVFSFTTYLAWTMIQVPYLALAAETQHNSNINQNNQNHHKQNNHNNPYVFNREAFGILGMLTIIILPFATDLEVSQPKFYNMFYWVFSAVLAISLILLYLSNIESKYQTHQKPKSLNSKWQNPIKQILHLKQEAPQAFKILKPYFINNLASAIPATLFVLFVEQYLNLKEQTGLFLLTYFLAGVIALPIWLWAVKKVGQLKIWRVSILLSIASFALAFALDQGDANLYLLICVLTGLSLVIDIVIPANIQNEISKELTQKGSNQNGLVFGLWGMTTKLSLALAIGLSFPLLEEFTAIGANQNTTLLSLYILPAIILKLWAWHQITKLKF